MKAPNFRRLLASICVGACVNGLTLATGVAQRPESLEPVSRIEALARAEAEHQLPALQARQTLLVGPIDARLRLTRCPTTPAARIGPGAKMADRVLIEITCNGGKQWRTYIPARIVGLTQAVKSARYIPAGHVIEAQDLSVADADASRLPLGYVTDSKSAIGSTAKRAIGPGMMLSSPLLSSSEGIVRGQTVTLVASGGGMDIRMAGRAVSDGYINQRVKVQNSSSGKIVEGIARSGRVVEIGLR